LLRPYPHFTGVSSNAFDGTTKYNSLQMKVEHRFVGGYQLLVGYTWSKFRERVSRLNATDTEYEERPASADTPHRLSISGIWELPFGQGRRFGGSVNRFTDSFIGGWSVQAIGQLQTGFPIDFGNLYYDGDPTKLKVKYSNNTDAPMFDTSGFFFHDAAVQTNGVPVLKTWDISLVKQVRLSGTVRAQFNIEFLNAFNQTYFNNANTDPTSANFGRVTSQNNLPRDIQLAAKIVF
jgi:hypothetical protein